MPADVPSQTEVSRTHSTEPPSSWLIRIPEVFTPLADDIISRLDPVACTKLGNEYCLIKTDSKAAVHDADVSMFVQWNLPVHHSWPCNPQKMDGFIEKAAQTLHRKFGPLNPQATFIGQLHPTPPNPYYKSLASNLRGRTLQLFPALAAKEVEEQDSERETLFCLVGKEGLFCGMQSPRHCNGLYPGGTKYISQNASETISRAGAKIAEALHYLLMYRPALPEGSHWVELGASPGGMTSELLARNYRVTAVDRAPLDKRLNRQPGLTFARADVATFQHVIRLSSHLKAGGIVVFTLKMPGVETVDETLQLFRSVMAMAARSGLRLLARTHLTYNRQEFTLFFTKDT